MLTARPNSKGELTLSICNWGGGMSPPGLTFGAGRPPLKSDRSSNASKPGSRAMSHNDVSAWLF